MAFHFQRRKCIALAMIIMLGVAEGRRIHQVSKATNKTTSGATDTQAQDQSVVVYTPRHDLTKEIAKTNKAVKTIQKGEGWLGMKYCMVSCPGLWVEVAYHQWQMRTAGYAVIAQSFGGESGSQPLTALVDADTDKEKPLATAFHSVMRKVTWTFLKAVDGSLVQRTLLTLLMAPLGLFRTVTGMSPMGLCFFKAAWKDIHDNDPEKYKQYNTIWWSAMLSGCPDTAPDAAFEDETNTASIIDSMISALASTEGLEHEDEAKWEGKATHKQCVEKLNSAGHWQKRELSIAKGIITWRSSSECDSEAWGQMRSTFGHSKSFAMQFLTTPSGSDSQLLQLFNRLNDNGSQSHCMGMQNAHRRFEFCAAPGADMAKAKQTIDEHIKLMGNERALLSTAGKVDRLVAAANLENVGGEKGVKKEQALLMEDDDGTGDTSTQGLHVLGDVPSSLQGQEGEEARRILNQVKEANSLISTGQDLANGTALLQEAFAAAHLNQHLSSIMAGKISQKGSRELTTGLGAGASAGTITTTELIIILIVCGGGFLCLGVLAMVAKNSLAQTSDRIEQYTDVARNRSKIEVLQRNTTQLVFPHAPHA